MYYLVKSEDEYNIKNEHNHLFNRWSTSLLNLISSDITTLRERFFNSATTLEENTILHSFEDLSELSLLPTTHPEFFI